MCIYALYTICNTNSVRAGNYWERWFVDEIKLMFVWQLYNICCIVYGDDIIEIHRLKTSDDNQFCVVSFNINSILWPKLSNLKELQTFISWVYAGFLQHSNLYTILQLKNANNSLKNDLNIVKVHNVQTSIMLVALISITGHSNIDIIQISYIFWYFWLLEIIFLRSHNQIILDNNNNNICILILILSLNTYVIFEL